MARILFYHDFVSPFCRLGVRTVALAADATGLELRPVPFELWPAPGPLPTVEEAHGDELEQARAAAREWGLDDGGLELGTLPRVPRTRKAHEAVAFARSHGSERVVLEAIYDALWAGGRDISRLDVLADIGADAGLDRETMHVALGLDDLEEVVVREQHAAAAAGHTGVPSVQVGDVVAVGLMSTDELVEWIEANR
jgi:predicted DsbA family dithiol-disulfide isomerase